MASGLPWPTPGAAEFDPTRLGWRAVVDELSDTGEILRHWLYVGHLSDTEPTARTPLVESPWPFSIFATQAPVTAGPAAGKVLYVADHGVSSELRVVGVDGVGDQPIGDVPQVVFAAALAPDGATAYLVLLDRATGSDIGVFALATDGTGDVSRVMGPAVGRQAALADGIVRVAVTRFVRSLYPSSDGLNLGRLACGTAFCGLEVLDLTTGAVESLQEPAMLEFYGIADGIVVALFDCRTPACGDSPRIEAVKLATHIRIPVGVNVGTTVATGGDGRLILLGQIGASQGNAAPEIRATDLRTGASRVLMAMEGVLLPQTDERFAVEMPWGWQWIGICDGAGACPIALNLSDGQQIPLADVQFQLPIGGGHD